MCNIVILFAQICQRVKPESLTTRRLQFCSRVRNEQNIHYILLKKTSFEVSQSRYKIFNCVFYRQLNSTHTWQDCTAECCISILLATNFFSLNTATVHIRTWLDTTALLVQINFLELQIRTLSQHL
jgi:hypothetical protein